MSYGNNEFHYSLFLRFNKSKLEEVLKCNLREIELEKPYLGRKLDIYSTTTDGIIVIGEVQLSVADQIHFNQLVKVLEMKDGITDLVLFWVALDFKMELLDAINDKINKSNKNVQFVALKLNNKLLEPGFIPRLATLRTIEVVENLNKLNNIERHFIVKEFYYKLQNENPVNRKTDTEICRHKLDDKEKILKCLLEEIRREVYYLPAVYRYKRLDKYVIVLGAGINDASFFIGLNRSNMIYLELRFTQNTKDIFDKIVHDKEKIDDMFNYLIEFDNDNFKLGSYFYIRDKNRSQVLKQVARMLNKYVLCFTEYTFNS